MGRGGWVKLASWLALVQRDGYPLDLLMDLAGPFVSRDSIELDREFAVGSEWVAKV